MLRCFDCELTGMFRFERVCMCARIKCQSSSDEITLIISAFTLVISFRDICQSSLVCDCECNSIDEYKLFSIAQRKSIYILAKSNVTLFI